MIVQKCMHIDATDARKKWKMWKMMQFVMSQDKTSIKISTPENVFGIFNYTFDKIFSKKCSTSITRVYM